MGRKREGEMTRKQIDRILDLLEEALDLIPEEGSDVALVEAIEAALVIGGQIKWASLRNTSRK